MRTPSDAARPFPPSEGQPAPVAARSRGRLWLGACVIALVVADDYAFRVRDPQDTLSGGVDAATLFSLALYGAVLTFLALAQPRLPRLGRMPPVMVLLTMYVLLMAASLVNSPYRELAAVRVGQVAIVLALVMFTAAHAARQDLHLMAHGFIGLVVISIAVGVVFPMPRFPLQEDRFTWLRLHPVSAGVIVGIAVCLLLVYLLAHSLDRPGPKWPLPVYLVGFGVCIGALIGTQTRGALAGVIVAVIMLVALRYRGRHRITWGLGSIVVVGLLWVWAGDLVLSYLARGESAANLATLNSRTELWGLAWDAILRHPVFGWGLEASRGVFLDAIGLGGGHNALINVAVDLGAVGVVLWASLLLALLLRTLRLDARALPQFAVDRLIILTVFVFLVVDGGTSESIGAVSNTGATWLFVLCGWLAVLIRDQQGKSATRVRSILPWRTGTPASDESQPASPQVLVNSTRSD